MANEFVARRGIIAQSGGAKITGSLLVSGTVDASGYNVIATSFTGSFSGSIGTATTASYVSPSGLPAGTVSSSTQVVWSSVNYNTGIVSSSAQVQPLLPANTVSSSAQVTAFLPTGTVSSSTQFKTLTDPFTGSFTGSFTGDGSGLTGIATVLGVSGSSGTATINLKTQALTINGGNGVTTSATGQSVTVSAPAGTVSASSQIDYNSIQNKLSGVVSSSAQVAPLLPGGTVSSSAQYPGWVTSSTQVVWSSVNYNTGIVSSSAQTVANVASQTIAPAIINATGAISGASIQVSGNGTVGGNLTVTGLLTAASQSIQYISSSTLNVATNKIVVNTNQSLQFGGISVVDSGSSNNSGSLYWDSINNRWIYENVTGGGYNSAVIIAGPPNTGAIGSERGMVSGRVPVAVGDDHIDTAAASSSIRVDYTGTKRTDIEAGLFVTGSLTANGVVTLASIPSSSAQIAILLPASTVSSSAQVQAFLPGGTVSSSAQYPGWVTASSQIALASITGTTFAASNFTFPQQLTVSGVLSGSTSAYLNNTLYSGSTVTGIVGPVTNQVVASVATGSFTAAHFDYTINDGTNYRTGTVMSVWSPSTVEYTDTSTNDIGNTAQASFVVDAVSGVARLKFTNVSGTWTVKTAVRAL